MNDEYSYTNVKATKKSLENAIRMIAESFKSEIKYASRCNNEAQVIIFRELERYLNGTITHKLENDEYEGQKVEWW